MSKFVNIASIMIAAKPIYCRQSTRKYLLEQAADHLKSIEGFGVDLAVFPEYMIYAQNYEQAEGISRPGEVLNLYLDFARRENCHVAASFRCLDGGKIYNSLAFIAPGGKILGVYHKVNLTVMAIEHGESSGSKAVVVDTEIGRLGGAVCFDLNFEQIRKDYAALKPDIMVFSSNYHGGLMQQLWAYECQSFFVSALPYMGGGILDPFGTPIKLTDCYTQVARARVNLDRVMVHLDFNRRKFPDIIRKYREEVFIETPPNIGAAVIYSNSHDRSAQDIFDEFELESLDNYFQRSLEANAANRSESK